MNRKYENLAKLERFLKAVGVVKLAVLLLLLMVSLLGCAKNSKEEKPASPNVMRAAIADPSKVDLAGYISSEEEVLEKLLVDVNKDGNKEIIFLSGKPSDVALYKSVKIRILTWDGSNYVSSWEQDVVGEVSVKLEAEDINKDSIVEVLSYQEMGASGSTLYVIAWNGSSYSLVKPVGGTLKNESFGIRGVEVKDSDNDGVKEIYAHYGPVGSKADIYKWDGKNYKFSRTVSSSSNGS